jgi:hypothetical protein
MELWNQYTRRWFDDVQSLIFSLCLIQFESIVMINLELPKTDIFTVQRIEISEQRGPTNATVPSQFKL